MFEGMKIVSRGDLAVLIASASVIGGAAVTVALELYEPDPADAPPAAQAPQVERTAGGAVVRFNTLIDGTPSACELRIEDRSRSFTLLCREARHAQL